MLIYSRQYETSSLVRDSVTLCILLTCGKTVHINFLFFIIVNLPYKPSKTLGYAILADVLTFNMRSHIEFGIGRLWRSLKIMRPFSSDLQM